MYLATNYSPEQFLKTLPVEDVNNSNNENDDDVLINGSSNGLMDSTSFSDLDLDEDENYNEVILKGLGNQQYIKYARYLQLCKHSDHANQIQQFIIATGQQLLTTLNL